MVDENNNEEVLDGNAAAQMVSNLDFNVEDEYKPNPLVPKGNYHGVVNKVSVQASQYAIMWDVCLHDNGGVKNDGVSPIDGTHVFFRNWLPKPGDENEMTKNGSSTKRQWKVNALADFSKALGINMIDGKTIATAIVEHQWIGLEVDVEVEIDEYNGQFRNSVNKMKKSTL